MTVDTRAVMLVGLGFRIFTAFWPLCVRRRMVINLMSQAYDLPNLFENVYAFSRYLKILVFIEHRKEIAEV